MHKLIAVLLSILVLAGCMTACSESGIQGSSYTLTLSDEKNAEIQNAWFKKTGHPLGIWYDPKNPETHLGSCRYYGSYDGYEIIFNPGVAEMLTTIKIAQQDFIHGSSFVIYAYQDGVFHKLEDVYESGKITADSIQKIFLIHKEIDELYYREQE